MATTIVQSVLAKFVAASLTDFDGSLGLWLGEIPENLPAPVVGFVQSGDSTEFTMEKEYFEFGTVTITIFATGVAETERLTALVLAAYDVYIKAPTGLNFTGGKVINWDRVPYTVTAEPTRDSQAKQKGRTDFRYAYQVQKSLP